MMTVPAVSQTFYPLGMPDWLTLSCVVIFRPDGERILGRPPTGLAHGPARLLPGIDHLQPVEGSAQCPALCAEDPEPEPRHCPLK